MPVLWGLPKPPSKSNLPPTLQVFEMICKVQICSNKVFRRSTVYNNNSSENEQFHRKMLINKLSFAKNNSGKNHDPQPKLLLKVH